MEKSENGDKKPNRIYNNLAILTIAIGVFLLVCLPYILTNFDIGWSFGNQNENPIGDTIGGISAPIIGLVSSVLVYLALKAQIDANSLINKQFEYERTNQDEKIYFEYLSQELDSISKFVSEFNLKINNFNNGEISIQNIDFCTILDEFMFTKVDYSKYNFNYSKVTLFFFNLTQKLNFYSNQKISNKSYSNMIYFKLENLIQLLWFSTTHGDLIEGKKAEAITNYYDYINRDMLEDIIEFQYVFAKLKTSLNYNIDTEKRSIGELNKLEKYFIKNNQVLENDINLKDFKPSDYPTDLSDYPGLQ